MLNLAVFAVLVPLAAQPAQQDTDSILHNAKRAQEQFERIRVQRLPRSLYSSGAGCDEYIGRFCYWDDEDDDWEAPPEHEEVIESRDSLLRVLRDAHRERPDSDWLVGQRVRYLIERGDLDEARGLTEECESAEWWCLALSGLVEHSVGNHDLADSHYGLSVEAMNRATQCRWRDISMLLEDELSEIYDDLPCTMRDTLETVVWWLADPFYLQPGNDRRVEHFTRQVYVKFAEESATSYETWGEDVREILLRFGWPTGIEQSMSPNGRTLTHHHPPHSRAYMPPDAAVLADVALLRNDQWSLFRTLPRSRHQTPYVEQVFDLEHQISSFRRGDSLEIIGAFALADSIEHSGYFEGGLIVGPGGYATQRITYLDSIGSSGYFIGVIDASSGLASIELLGVNGEVGGRARSGYRSPTLDDAGIGLSDLLVFSIPPDEEELPETLSDAAVTALGSLRLESGSRIGLYWEIYGLAGASSQVADIEVTLERQDRGFFRSLAESIGIAGRRGPAVELNWLDRAAGEETQVFPRSVSLNLGDIDEGRYLLNLVVRLAGDRELVTTRDIYIVD